MARTSVPATALTRDASTLQPAGVALDPANGHTVAAEGLNQETYLDIDSTFAGAKTFTIKAGFEKGAALGDLVVSLNAQRALIGPLSGYRFMQADGSFSIDVAAGATGTIRAYRFPGSAVS
jgi:hypothetical protein